MLYKIQIKKLSDTKFKEIIEELRRNQYFGDPRQNKIAIDFLENLLKKTLLEEEGHNLYKFYNDYDCLPNKEYALKLGCCRETLRQKKEELHARNIILIDGLNWDQYRTSKGRHKPNKVQTISFTEEFIQWCYSVLEKRIKPWIFDFCKGFTTIFLKRKEKQEQARKRWLLKILNNLKDKLLKSEDKKDKTPEPTPKAPETKADKAERSKLNKLIDDINVKKHLEPHLKKWTKATLRTIENLKKTFDLDKIADIMTEQKYAINRKDFFTRYKAELAQNK